MGGRRAAADGQETVGERPGPFDIENLNILLSATSCRSERRATGRRPRSAAGPGRTDAARAVVSRKLSGCLHQAQRLLSGKGD